MGAQGFISIVFDQEGSPLIVIAGDVEPFKTVGTLEFCKIELINQMIYEAAGFDVEDNFELSDDEFED